jgi:hypothetical protein
MLQAPVLTTAQGVHVPAASRILQLLGGTAGVNDWDVSLQENLLKVCVAGVCTLHIYAVAGY